MDRGILFGEASNINGINSGASKYECVNTIETS